MAKERFSITLSKRSAEMVRELKESTDADTDSEVIRNAIRLSYSIMLAQKSGARLCVEDAEGTKLSLPMFHYF